MRLEPHYAGVNRMARIFLLACSIGFVLTCLPSQSPATTASKSVSQASDGVYLNPDTGRFWSMDSYDGNNNDPRTLHKYLYSADNPVMNADPSGKAAWLVTRPLGIPGLSLLAPIAVHVFLVFDDNLSGTIGGGDPLPTWQSEVQQDNQNVGTIVPAVINKWGAYQSDPHLTTFSFHPYSVATGDGEKDQASVLATEGSCVAYNAPEDRGAFYQAGGNAWGYQRRWITSDINEQISLYRLAAQSRNVNNSGNPDPSPYSFPTYNCGSWTQTILKRAGISYPSDFINLGTGLGGPLAMTGIPTLIGTAAKGWNPHYDGMGGIGVFTFGF